MILFVWFAGWICWFRTLGVFIAFGFGWCSWVCVVGVSVFWCTIVDLVLWEVGSFVVALWVACGLFGDCLLRVLTWCLVWCLCWVVCLYCLVV